MEAHKKRDWRPESFQQRWFCDAADLHPNEASPEGYTITEAICVSKCLDDHGVPHQKDGEELSLWGRVKAYGDLRSKEGLGSEHETLLHQMASAYEEYGTGHRETNQELREELLDEYRKLFPNG